MNKKIASLVIFISLFCVASLSLADVILVNPLNVEKIYDPSGGPSLLTNILTKVGEAIGALAAIMLVVAGILYLTSAGSPEKIGTAKKALTYSIIGIVIGTLASTIPSIIQDVLGKK